MIIGGEILEIMEKEGKKEARNYLIERGYEEAKAILIVATLTLFNEIKEKEKVND